ncbi:MAG: dephospho-CoA kinase [Spirochaetes bacterium]|nr:dephospho-CoA kinase [Spirochaetota bacterium]
MLIGLTGKYCSGKNHIASILEKKGLLVLDVDKLGYHALETEKAAVFAQFGSDLQKPDGSLDRRLLGQRVFGNPEKLKLLESIVHPPVNRLTAEWTAKNKDKTCVINAALLHKSEVFGKLDRIILVTAPFFTRLFRAKQRDRLSLTEILKRFSSQKDFNSQYLSANAEIKRVGNPGLSGSRKIQQKLERRIDMILEGIC